MSCGHGYQVVLLCLEPVGSSVAGKQKKSYNWNLLLWGVGQCSLVSMKRWHWGEKNGIGSYFQTGNNMHKNSDALTFSWEWSLHAWTTQLSPEEYCFFNLFIETLWEEACIYQLCAKGMYGSTLWHAQWSKSKGLLTYNPRVSAVKFYCPWHTKKPPSTWVIIGWVM